MLSHLRKHPNLSNKIKTFGHFWGTLLHWASKDKLVCTSDLFKILSGHLCPVCQNFKTNAHLGYQHHINKHDEFRRAGIIKPAPTQISLTPAILLEDDDDILSIIDSSLNITHTNSISQNNINNVVDHLSQNANENTRLNVVTDENNDTNLYLNNITNINEHITTPIINEPQADRSPDSQETIKNDSSQLNIDTPILNNQTQHMNSSQQNPILQDLTNINPPMNSNPTPQTVPTTSSQHIQDDGNIISYDRNTLLRKAVKWLEKSDSEEDKNVFFPRLKTRERTLLKNHMTNLLETKIRNLVLNINESSDTDEELIITQGILAKISILIRKVIRTKLRIPYRKMFAAPRRPNRQNTRREACFNATTSLAM
ncbi:hypothetical protein TRFO_33292 [Tritrichomonas foetus]|uniref:Uncharacterized protein n=1 Tax=Tritrichomonas foetus TaxID=1144522 RepID=A0A1J4JS39_9EUKA|nr:hypothetical protein TRFO_33292 [Tritrichomonas foetus]|eukprot:OHT00061.1 hypothetical protein TRFO_33292 [Tritrichomonas foetus]